MGQSASRTEGGCAVLCARRSVCAAPPHPRYPEIRSSRTRLVAYDLREYAISFPFLAPSSGPVPPPFRFAPFALLLTQGGQRPRGHGPRASCKVCASRRPCGRGYSHRVYGITLQPNPGTIRTPHRDIASTMRMDRLAVVAHDAIHRSPLVDGSEADRSLANLLEIHLATDWMLECAHAREYAWQNDERPLSFVEEPRPAAGCFLLLDVGALRKSQKSAINCVFWL